MKRGQKKGTHAVPGFTAKEKRAVQRLARRAIRQGKLVRQTCEQCAAQGVQQRGISQAHHEDYSRPLDVTWLCAIHHKWRHMEIYYAFNAPFVYPNARWLWPAPQFAGAAE